MRLPIVVFLALAVAGCNKKGEQVQASGAPPEPIAVQAAKAESRRVERAILVTGELLPDESVSISFEVAGRVASIHADFGQQVRKGQVLATLDPREYQIQVDRTKALLTQALARIGLSPDQVNVTPTTSPAIRQAEAQLADARSKYESAAKLIKTGDIAQERFTELDKVMAARQAALDAAKDELRTLTASVQSLRADLNLAEKRLTDTTVRAPFDAAVTERSVSPGQYIKENTTVLKIVKSDPLRLRLEVPESATGTIRVGSTMTFTTDAAPGQTFTTTIRELNPALDQKSRVMTAEARIPNPQSKLRPGTFVQVRLVTARDVEITTVPKSALYHIAGLTKVFAIRDGKANEYRIPPGIEGDNWAEVPSASVKPGDLVAASNLAALTDKAPVKVR